MDSAWSERLLEAVNSIKRMKQRANNDRISRYLKRYDATDSTELAHQIEQAVKHGILVELRNADDIAYVDPKQNPTIKNQPKLTPDDEKQLFRELMRAVQTLTRSRKRNRTSKKNTTAISKDGIEADSFQCQSDQNETSVKDNTSVLTASPPCSSNSSNVKHVSNSLVVVEGVPMEAIEQHLRARFQLKIENGLFRQKLNNTLNEALAKGFLDKCEGKFLCTGKSPPVSRSAKSSAAPGTPNEAKSAPLSSNIKNEQQPLRPISSSSNLKEEESISRLVGVKKEDSEKEENASSYGRSGVKSTPQSHSRCHPKKGQHTLNSSPPKSNKKLVQLTPRSRKKSLPPSSSFSPPSAVNSPCQLSLPAPSSPQSLPRGTYTSSRQRKKTAKYSPTSFSKSAAKVKSELEKDKAALVIDDTTVCDSVQRALVAAAAPSPALVQVSSVTRIRLKKPTKPIMVCSFCLGDENLNKKTGLVEPMMSCADCGRSGHPTCMCWSDKLFVAAKRLRWQCMECKQCSRCGRVSKKDTNLLLCDGCDRGFHMQCVEPILTRLPKGQWYCNICDPERAGPRLSIFEDELGAPAMTEELTDGLTLFYTPSNKRNSRVSSNSFMQKHYVMNDSHNQRRAHAKDRPVGNKSAGQQAAAKLLQKVKKRGASTIKSVSEKADGSPPPSNSNRQLSDGSGLPRKPGRPFKSGSAASRTKDKRKALVPLLDVADDETQDEVKSTKRRRKMKLEDGTSTVSEAKKRKLIAKPAAASAAAVVAPASVVPTFNLTDEEVREAVAECMAKELARAQPTVTPEDDELYASAQTRTRQEMARLVASLSSAKVEGVSCSTAEENSNSCSSFQTIDCALNNSTMLPAMHAGSGIVTLCERYPPIIEIGKYEIETWYSAPYPQEYARLPKLYICEFCLKYLKTKNMLQRHVKKCELNHPPSTEIYRHDNLSVFEVNGQDSKLYCQNLCLLAKLFLDHKTLYYDVEPFLFYVLTVNDAWGCHIVGYFSKEKRSAQCYNVSCIMTLPCYQQCGYGRFLIDFSYLLSRIEGESGSPEKPLSELGRLSYHSYWRSVVLEWLDARKDSERNTFCIQNLCKDTGLDPHDVNGTLSRLGMLEINTQEPSGCSLCVNRAELAAYMAQTAKKRAERIYLCERSLRWTPLVSNTSYQDADTSGEAECDLSCASQEEEEEEDVVPTTATRSEQKPCVLKLEDVDEGVTLSPPMSNELETLSSSRGRLTKKKKSVAVLTPKKRSSTPRFTDASTPLRSPKLLKQAAKDVLPKSASEKQVKRRAYKKRRVMTLSSISGNEAPSNFSSSALIVEDESTLAMKDDSNHSSNMSAAVAGCKSNEAVEKKEDNISVSPIFTSLVVEEEESERSNNSNKKRVEDSSRRPMVDEEDDKESRRKGRTPSQRRSCPRRSKTTSAMTMATKRSKSNKGLRRNEEMLPIAMESSCAALEKLKNSDDEVEEDEADSSFQLEEDFNKSQMCPCVPTSVDDVQVEHNKLSSTNNLLNKNDDDNENVIDESKKMESVPPVKEDDVISNDVSTAINEGEDKTDGNIDSSDGATSFFQQLSDNEAAEVAPVVITSLCSAGAVPQETNVSSSIENEVSCVNRDCERVDYRLDDRVEALCASSGVVQHSSDPIVPYGRRPSDNGGTCLQQGLPEQIYSSQSLSTPKPRCDAGMTQELTSVAQLPQSTQGASVHYFSEMQSTCPNSRPSCLSPNDRYASRQPKHYEYPPQSQLSQLQPPPSSAVAAQSYYRNSTTPGAATYGGVYNNASESQFAAWHPSRHVYPPPHPLPPAQMHQPQQHQMQHHAHNEHAEAYTFQQMQQQPYPHPPINYPPMYGGYHAMDSDPYTLPPNVAANYYQLQEQPFYPMQRYPPHHGSAYSSALPH